MTGGIGSNGLDQALEHTGDGVFVVGPDGRIIFWNPAAEKILGYGAREAVGRSCCDLFGGHDDHGNRLCHPGCQPMTLIRMGEAVQSFDMRTRTKAGRGVWLNVSTLVVPSNGRRGPLTAHLFRDVTATKELLTLVREEISAPAATAEATAALTRRELEVLRLMASGANTRTAAERLHVSPATIRNHAQNIFGKLGVHSRLQAVAHATRQRWL